MLLFSCPFHPTVLSSLGYGGSCFSGWGSTSGIIVLAWMCEAPGSIHMPRELDVVAHTQDPCAPDVEAWGSRPTLCSRFKDSLGDIKPWRAFFSLLSEFLVMEIVPSWTIFSSKIGHGVRCIISIRLIQQENTVSSVIMRHVHEFWLSASYTESESLPCMAFGALSPVLRGQWALSGYLLYVGLWVTC